MVKYLLTATGGLIAGSLLVSWLDSKIIDKYRVLLDERYDMIKSQERQIYSLIKNAEESANICNSLFDEWFEEQKQKK